MVKCRQYSEAERLKMFELRKNGKWTYQKIADRFGCIDDSEIQYQQNRKVWNRSRPSKKWPKAMHIQK